jgi:hypothetical protein
MLGAICTTFIMMHECTMNDEQEVQGDVVWSVVRLLNATCGYVMKKTLLLTAKQQT